MVQKVSAIYSAGTTRRKYTGPSEGLGVPFGSGSPVVVVGQTTLYGTSQTDLSRKLASPAKPKFRLEKKSSRIINLNKKLLLKSSAMVAS